MATVPARPTRPVWNSGPSWTERPCSDFDRGKGCTCLTWHRGGSPGPFLDSSVGKSESVFVLFCFVGCQSRLVGFAKGFLLVKWCVWNPFFFKGGLSKNAARNLLIW